MTRAPNLLVVGLILLLASAATYGTLRLTYGERPAYVHVRWAPSVDTSTREQLERVHSLTRAELREGRTWGYYLTRSLARQHPATRDQPRRRRHP